jgi:hypothetical protein
MCSRASSTPLTASESSLRLETPLRSEPRAIATACTTAYLLVLIACHGAPSPVSGVGAEPSGDPVLRVVDDAIQVLADPAADSEKILRDAAAALPTAAGDRARAEIEAFLARVPQPGADYRCSADFIRTRSRQVLVRLRDTSLGINTSPLEPAICYVAPFAVDATRRDAVGPVHVYGFDFDAVDLQLVSITPDGFRDVTPALTVESHAHLIIEVGEGGAPVSATTQSLGLGWGNVIHHRIPFVRPTTRVCSSRLETIPAGSVVSYAPVGAGRSGPPGRTQIGTAADVRLEYSFNAVEAALCVTAADPIASGCTVAFLYTTDPERVIDGVLGDLTDQTALANEDGPDGEQNAGRSGLVAQWTRANPRSDTSGDAALVSARLNEIKLVSSEAESCISPIAYLEARRADALAPATRRALDEQLAAIDPVIATLRPRFAPDAP